MMPESAVVDWVSNFVTNNDLWKIQPSFFELTVAMAFDYFAHQEIDVADNGSWAWRTARFY